MEARALLSSIRRYWWLVLALVVGGAIVGVGATELTPVTYVSTASLSISEPNLGVVTGTAGGGTSPAYVSTQVGVLQSDSVIRKAAGKAGVTVARMERSADVAERDSSNIIDVKMSAGTPKAAQRMAQALADEYLARQNDSSALASSASSLKTRMRDLQDQIGSAQSPRVAAALQSQYNVLAQQLAQVQLATQLGGTSAATLISAAGLPPAPAPRHGLIFLAGGSFGGVVAGVVCALLLSLRSPQFRTAQAIEDFLDIPVAVDLPRVRGATAETSFTDLAERSSRFGQQFDALVALVAGATDDGEFGPKQVAVTTISRGLVTRPLATALRERFEDPSLTQAPAQESAQSGTQERGSVLTATTRGPEPVTGVLVDDLGRLLDHPETVLSARTADVLVLLVALPTGDGHLLQTTIGSVLRKDHGRILVVTSPMRKEVTR